MTVLQLHGPMAFRVLQWCHPMPASIKEDKLLFSDDHLIWCPKVDSGPRTGMTSTLISSVLLMSTSTTAHDRGGTLMFLFKETEAIAVDWYSAVSAMTSLFCVSWRVFDFVQDMPMQFFIEKSLPRIIGLFRCSHTINVW